VGWQAIQMERALVIGGSGFIGRSLVARLGPDRGIGTWRAKPVKDMVQFDATSGRLAELCRRLPAKMTHVFVPFGLVNPEQCARDPAGSAEINVTSVIRVLDDALNAGLVPVFVSTDYVYDGRKITPAEDEPQSPITEYGRQKTAVERWLANRNEPWLIARLSKVVSGDTTTHSVLGQWVNDIREGRPMRSATDQIFSPASADDVAGAMIKLAETGLNGIYHVAGPEPLSRYDLNVMLMDAVRTVDNRIRASVERCSLCDIPFLEQRPLNTSLSTQKLRAAIAWPFQSMRDLCRQIANSEFA
jgi:dTDP-4-dehydrorhamnose reductase